MALVVGKQQFVGLSCCTSLKLLILLMAILSANGFYTIPVPPVPASVSSYYGNGGSVLPPQKRRSIILLQMGLGSGGDGSRVDRSFSTTRSTKNSMKRRAVLAKFFATAVTTTAVLGGKATMSQNPSPWTNNNKAIVGDSSTMISSTTTIQRLDSLDEALKVIESSCDKRFLHAIVASDYHLLYRGVDQREGGLITIRNEPCDLLDATTYGSEDAVQYFTRLEKQLQNRPLQPSNSHLATTSVIAAKSWGGGAVSVWPLAEADDDNSNDNVHFAWKEEGGVFWPSNSESGITAVNVPQSIIVDGVDCGRQSLDDALQQDNSEIMFRANRFLAVPTSMEDALISKLKGAYLI